MKKTVKIFAASACFFLALVCFTVTATYAWFIDRGVEGSFAVAAVKVEAVTGEGENEVVTELGTYILKPGDTNTPIYQSVAKGTKLRFTNWTAEPVSFMLVFVNGEMFGDEATEQNHLNMPTYENGEPTGGITELVLTEEVAVIALILQ